jgi:hypothetical protein
VVWLLRDAPDEGEREIARAHGEWQAQRGQFAMQMQDLLSLTARCDLAIYRGELDVAQRLVDEVVPGLRRALLDRPPTSRMLLTSTLARLALARAAAAPAGSSERQAELVAARRQVRAVRKLPQPGAVPVVSLLEAGLAALAGERDAEIAALRAAVTGLDAFDTGLFSHAARRRLARLVGGDEGAALAVQADGWFAAQGVANPDRLTAMLAPGWPS